MTRQIVGGVCLFQKEFLMEELIKEWKEKFEDIDADIDILQKEIDTEKSKGTLRDVKRLQRLEEFKMMLMIWKNRFKYFQMVHGD